MRKILLSLLMATTAATVTTPALAQRADRDDRAEEREERRKERAEARKERTEAREETRTQRVEQPQRVVPQRAERTPRIDREQRIEQRQDARQQDVRVRDRATRPANVNERGRPTLQERQQSREALVESRQQQREQAREQRIDSRERYLERVAQRPVTPPANARPDRPAPPPPTATNHRAPQWHTTWRHDNRYDWRRWRDRNRSHFRLGVYFDPFGWNYRRYNVGWRLWPSYYSDSHWLDDPFMYRLPYAPWPYRWVRYYDDVLLVNTMSGQVVDVIYDFFW